MPELEEFRYPWNSCVEFFAGGYFKDFLALHLTLAYIAILVLCVVLFRSKRTLVQKLVTLYFALTLFTNFAFEVGGVTIGDAFGILACGIFLLQSLFNCSIIRIHRLAFGLIALFGLIIAHQIAIGSIYPELNEGTVGITRIAVTLKIVVFAIVVWAFSREFRTTDSLHWLLQWTVSFALIGVGAYFVQGMILATGHLPYGTFFDAGYVGIPAFGSVSIERGHFGKFLTPLFPVFLIMYRKHHRKWAWIGFVVVTTINVSASSLAYFTVYLLLTAFAYRDRLKKPKYLAGATVILAGVVAICIAMRNVLWGLVDKIITLGFEGQSGGGSGGRGAANFLDYVRLYPLGMSYGGSTLRNISSLDEMNSGIMAFFTQFGIISPIVLGAYLALVVVAIRRAKQFCDPVTRRMLVIGILMTGVIFATDILWFVPTIWLPIIIAMTGTEESRCPFCNPPLNRTRSHITMDLKNDWAGSPIGVGSR